jgi:hypothetical protein
MPGFKSICSHNSSSSHNGLGPIQFSEIQLASYFSALGYFFILLSPSQDAKAPFVASTANRELREVGVRTISGERGLQYRFHFSAFYDGNVNERISFSIAYSLS